MKKSGDWEIIIVGGGLAGLTAALHLTKLNLKVCVIEKNSYPNHKVCGEYVSNEVLFYLKYLGIDPFAIGAKKIDTFEISDSKGNLIKANLPLGGFGISRYAFDDMLYQSVKLRATVIVDTVDKIEFKDDQFKVVTKSGSTLVSNFVLGAFGKRSNLDVYLKREFISQKSYWLAVKSHYEFDMPENIVSLHNFEGGYCGLSKTETNSVNACYLTTYKSFKKYGDIDLFQRQEMSKNPFLREFFNGAKAIFKKPLTISQISFDEKRPVENHIFMIGDSAGLIHPLCGNGMAMAIKSAQIFCELYEETILKKSMSRLDLEDLYSLRWRNEFSQRLKIGSLIQKTLMYPLTSKVGFSMAKMFPSILPKIIKKTHGSVQ